MSDTQAVGGNGPQETPSGTTVRILGQYIKDLSFEVPNAPEIYNLLRQGGPDIPITLDASVRNISTGVFEVSLTIGMTATAGDKKAFIVELTYCALVELNEQIVPKEHVHPLLLIEIPRQIFPFVRQIIGDITGQGGFPPLMLEMVDFAALYRQKFASGEAAPPQPVH